MQMYDYAVNNLDTSLSEEKISRRNKRKNNLQTE